MAISKYLIIIFLAPTLILLNFQILVFNKHFYKREFTKLNVYEHFTKQEVDTQSANLIRYLCCKDKLEEDFFDRREILHLMDVKNLIRLATVQFAMQIFLIISCVVILLRGKKVNLLCRGLKWGSLFTILSIVILWLSSFISVPRFEKTFVTFHQVAFNNDLWQFPPQSNLIKLFPQQFFADFANAVGLLTVLESLLLLFAAKIIKDDTEKH